MYEIDLLAGYCNGLLGYRSLEMWIYGLCMCIIGKGDREKGDCTASAMHYTPRRLLDLLYGLRDWVPDIW